MKLGSLFDGSGGFPLAGALCGIEPIWASEVEPYPIAVTSTRFPNIKHLGDISKINGGEIEPVDIITFGSPCQDLSVAGKRAGLKHEGNGDDETTRSGLFIEAVRIIKEMRKKTNGEYPRFAVWENVPGAFSSNKGEDFRIVLEELIKVVEPTAVMPEVPRFGWAYADSYCGDGWSLAYRVFDAQYWGVPQRRRRIYLVADFGGQCAREILFEREGLRGYFTEGRTPWKATPNNVERSIGADDREGKIPYTLKIRSGVSVDSYGKAAGKGALIQKNLSATLGVSQDQYLFQPIGADPYNGDLTVETSRTLDLNGGNPACNQGGIAIVEPIAVATQQGGAEITENGICPTITAAAGMSGNNQPWICQGLDAYNQALTGDKSKTLNSAASDADHVPCIVLDDQGGSQISVRHDGKSPTLRAEMHGNVPCVMESAGFCPEQSAKTRGIGYEEEVSPTLRSGVTPACVYSVENHPADSRVNIDDSGKVQCLTSRMGTGGGNVPMVMETVALEGNGQRPSHRGDGYAETDKSYTLNSTEVHGVAYSFDPGASRDVGVLFIEECGKTLTNGTCPGHHDGVVIAKPLGIGIQSSQGIDKIGEDLSPTLINGSNPGWQIGVAIEATHSTEPVLTASKASFFMNTDENLASTLVATDYKDPQLVAFDTATHKYIVRRLTPTECARLQGFADRWGDIEEKSEFSDEEYRFWHDVRNTHAAINGKAVKEYDKKQMLTWYNKLHTDSAEYKMWGNGIALPTALYVIQGIREVSNESY